MRIIGLSGGSGTGKSTIAAHLVSQGAGHIDADRIGHEALESNEEVRRAVRDRFGEAVFRDGHVDRAALGAVVFNDAGALAALNAIIHPPIVGECVRRLEAFRKRGIAMAVVDAALLLEVPVPFVIDLMIALRCDRAEQVRRLIAKGVAREDIDARLRTQAAIEKSFYKADVVIDTGRPISEVLTEIDGIIRFLLRRGTES